MNWCTGFNSRTKSQAPQIYLGEKDYTSAARNFTESLRLRNRIGDSAGMANNLMNLGGINYYLGNFSEATEYYYRALRIANDLNDANHSALALKNISNIHTRQNNHHKAIEYLLQALDHYRSSGSRKSESDVLLNLGIAYFRLGDITKAGNVYLESLKIKEDLGDDISGIMKLYNNLGMIAREQGDESKAMEYYASALDMARQINDKHTEAITLSNLGARMMVKGDTASLPLLLKSLELAQGLGLKKLLLNIYDNLQQYHSKFEDYEQAYYYALNYQAMNDTIFNEESTAKIIELQTKYDTEMKEKENEILRNQASILQLRILILAISAVAIAIIAFSIILVFMLKRKAMRQSLELMETENKLNRLEIEKQEKETRHLQEVVFAEEQINKLQHQQLQDKNRELSTSALQIINKNEALNNIREIAVKALKDDECDGKTCIQQLIYAVDANINLGEQWEVFKKHFESVHTGFFARLLEKHPTLTQNELKLCAYLRMNLSSKEIAQMLNISIESGNTKRYRLRKKLQLANEENLVTFLSDF
jgi:DNA-binding CsgD family transcriptional regulator/Tfp pilus assembly protein PilF